MWFREFLINAPGDTGLGLGLGTRLTTPMTCKKEKAFTIVLTVLATLLLTCEEINDAGKRHNSIK